MLCGVVARVFAVDDDVLNERILQLDAVRKLFAHESGDGRQKQQRTEREDSEVNRPQQYVEKHQPAVLLLRLAHHSLRNAVVVTAAIDELRVTASVVNDLLITHSASRLQSRHGCSVY